MFSDDFQDDDLINMGRKEEPAPVPRPSEETSNESVTFVTAKAAPTVQNKRPVTQENMFDPKYQAQSIRHTVDQTTSKPVPASLLKEKGIDDSRESSYEKSAAKGKQIEYEGSVSQPSAIEPNLSAHINYFLTIRSSKYSNSSQFMSSVLPQPPKPTRREVGRPKVNPPHLRKASP